MIDHPTPTQPNKPSPHPLNIALAHDWLVGRRGGELVLDAIINTINQDQHRITSIYCMFDTGKPITDAIDTLPKSISPLNKYPPALRRWLLFRYPSAVRALSRQLASDHAKSPIDLIISTHSAAIKAIESSPKPDQQIPHLCYCHTPARYLWSQGSLYNAPGLKGSLRSLGLWAATPTLREWDRKTADAVTQFIANSTHTAQQIKEHYTRDSVVIHPPVRTDFFTLPDPESTPAPKRTDALLLVSALEPYKRVDLAIDAAALANRELLIVGSGSHNAQLRKHARKARAKHGSRALIRFLGQLTDSQLRTQYQSASAFLFPQIEDFGITAVEAQASGCPVIARQAGGALDTVIEASQSPTGTFFDEPTPEAIAQAIERVPASQDTPQHCRANALRFSESVFIQKMSDLIHPLVNQQISRAH
jgi:glycosyltransferase involved in cell wall biosynthesis